MMSTRWQLGLVFSPHPNVENSGNYVDLHHETDRQPLLGPDKSFTHLPMRTKPESHKQEISNSQLPK